MRASSSHGERVGSLPTHPATADTALVDVAESIPTFRSATRLDRRPREKDVPTLSGALMPFARQLWRDGPILG